MIRWFVLILVYGMASIASAQPTQFTTGFRMPFQVSEHSLQQTTDSGYILCTSRFSFVDTGSPPVNRGYLIKLNPAGSIQWARMFPKAAYYNKVNDDGNSVIQTADGGYMIATSYHFRYNINSPDHSFTYLIKTNANGAVQWSQLYRGQGVSMPYCIKQTADHGYIVCGGTGDTIPPLITDGFLLRIDSTGNVLWAKAYDCVSTPGATKFHSVIELPSGEFVVAGQAMDGVILKTDAAGAVIWSQVAFTGVDILRDVIELPGNRLLAVGGDYPNYRTGLYELDTAGNFLWGSYYRFGGEFRGCAIVRTASGYTIAGERGSLCPGSLAHLDLNYNPVWSYFYPELNYFLTPSLTACYDGGYAFTGMRYNSNSTYDWSIVVTKTDSLGRAWCDSAVTSLTANVTAPSAVTMSVTSWPAVMPVVTVFSPVNFAAEKMCLPAPTGIALPAAAGGVNIFPNPANDHLTVELNGTVTDGARIRMCDIAGRTVFEDRLRSNRQEIDLSALSPGVYILLIEQNGAIVGQKRVIRQ